FQMVKPVVASNQNFERNLRRSQRRMKKSPWNFAKSLRQDCSLASVGRDSSTLDERSLYDSCPPTPILSFLLSDYSEQQRHRMHVLKVFGIFTIFWSALELLSVCTHGYNPVCNMSIAGLLWIVVWNHHQSVPALSRGRSNHFRRHWDGGWKGENEENGAGTALLPFFFSLLLLGYIILVEVNIVVFDTSLSLCHFCFSFLSP
ncbi:hypothetical protein PENTCL1PPCAC_21943, partial [Pristionchus entomophagus]